MTIVLFFLAAFGFAFVVGHSKISLPIRQWLGGWTEASATPNVATGEVIGHVVPHAAAVPLLGPFLVALAECPGCLGWWLGALTPLVWPALVAPFGLPLWPSMLMLAFSTSAVNLLLARYVGMV